MTYDSKIKKEKKCGRDIIWFGYTSISYRSAINNNYEVISYSKLNAK